MVVSCRGSKTYLVGDYALTHGNPSQPISACQKDFLVLESPDVG